MPRIAIAPAKVLDLIRNKLIGNGVFTDSTCFVSIDNKKPEYPPGDDYVLIDFFDNRLDQGYAFGSGNDCLKIVSQVGLTYWTSNALDEASHDTAAITSSAYGSLRRIQQIMNALELYDPVQNINEGLFGEPMRLIYWGKPEKDPDAPQYRKVFLLFEVVYLLSLDASENEFNILEFDDSYSV